MGVLSQYIERAANDGGAGIADGPGELNQTSYRGGTATSGIVGVGGRWVRQTAQMSN